HKQGRYHVIQISESWRPPPPFVPWAYILNLAVRADGMPRPDRPIPSLDDILSLAIDVVATLDTQRSSYFQTLYSGGAALLSNMARDAVYDSCATLVQLRPTDVVPLLDGIFGRWIDSKLLLESRGFSFSTFLSVSGLICTIGLRVRGPARLS